MRKQDFILKVRTTDEIPFGENLEEDGYTLSITAWEPNNGPMIDDHVTSYFQELENFGIEELAEGDMCYAGNLSKQEVMDWLTRMGYTVN